MNKQLIEVSVRQCGYFTAKQAVSCGYVRQHHAYHVRQGHWLRIDRGLYRLPEFADDLKAELIHWCLWSRDNNDSIQAVASHWTALKWHGLEGDLYAAAESEFIDLTVPRTFAKKAPACLRLHQRELPVQSILDRSAFRVTTPFQTLQDIEAISGRQGEVRLAARQAMEKGLLSLEQLEFFGGLVAPLSLSAVPGQEASPVPVIESDIELIIPEIAAPGLAEDDVGAGEVVLPLRSEQESEAEEVGMAIGEAKGGWRDQRRLPGFSLARERISREGLAGSRAAFTLVELLVVMAIISVLAAMLVPALQRSLSYARQTECANHLKQINLAFTLYADDYRDYIIRNFEQYGSEWWHWHQSCWVNGSVATNYRNSLTPYVGTPQEMHILRQCPDGNNLAGAGNYHGYTVNGNVMVNWNNPHRSRSRLAERNNPAELIVMADRRKNADFDPSYRFYADDQSWGPYGFINAAGVHHSGRANTLCLDGHIKALYPEEGRFNYLITAKY